MDSRSKNFRDNTQKNTLITEKIRTIFLNVCYVFFVTQRGDFVKRGFTALEHNHEEQEIFMVGEWSKYLYSSSRIQPETYPRKVLGTNQILACQAGRILTKSPA